MRPICNKIRRDCSVFIQTSRFRSGGTIKVHLNPASNILWSVLEKADLVDILNRLPLKQVYKPRCRIPRIKLEESDVAE